MDLIERLEKTANTHSMMDRLEKTAYEWQEDGRAGAELGAAFGGAMGLLGGAGLGGAAKGIPGAIGGALLGTGIGAGAGAIGGFTHGAPIGAAKDIIGYTPEEGQSHILPTAVAGVGSGALLGAAGALGTAATGNRFRGAINDGVRSLARNVDEDFAESLPDVMPKADIPSAALQGAQQGAFSGGLAGTVIGAHRNEKDEAEARRGAKSVSNAAAGEDKTASELMDRLEKSAANVAGAVKGFANKVTGKDYKAAKNQFDTQNSPEALQKAVNNGVDVSSFRNNLEKLETKTNTAKADMTKARKQLGTGVAGVGVVGTGVAGANVATKTTEEEKVASDLMGNLEKIAGNYIDDLLGRNVRDAKKGLKGAESVPRQRDGHRPNMPEIIQHKKDLKEAKKDQAKAVGVTATGAAIGAAAGEAAKAKKDGKQEKKASENEEFMNGLYKEAAAQIINEVIPEVKHHTDPINRIKFSK